jgi:hypothetical protein
MVYLPKAVHEVNDGRHAFWIEGLCGNRHRRIETRDEKLADAIRRALDKACSEVCGFMIVCSMKLDDGCFRMIHQRDDVGIFAVTVSRGAPDKVTVSEELLDKDWVDIDDCTSLHHTVNEMARFMYDALGECRHVADPARVDDPGDWVWFDFEEMRATVGDHPPTAYKLGHGLTDYYHRELYGIAIREHARRQGLMTREEVQAFIDGIYCPSRVPFYMTDEEHRLLAEDLVDEHGRHALMAVDASIEEHLECLYEWYRVPVQDKLEECVRLEMEKRGIKPWFAEESPDEARVWYGKERSTWLILCDGKMYRLADWEMLELVRRRVAGDEWRDMLDESAVTSETPEGPSHDLDWVERDYREWLENTLWEIAEEYTYEIGDMGVTEFVRKHPELLSGNTPFVPSDIVQFGLDEEND